MSGALLLLPKLTMLLAVLAAFVLDSLPLGLWRRRLLLGVAVLFLAAAVFDLFLLGEETRFWDGSLIVDRYAVFSDLALLVLGIVITLSVVNSIGSSKESGDFFLLLYLSLLGASLLASAGTLVSLFLAVELAIIPSWALVAFRLADRRGFEAALKYFILSVFASAILLYGLSLLYGMTGSVRIPLEVEAETSGLLVLGIALVIVGFGFELAAFPFHQWLPDVFDAAASEVSAFLAVAPKLAGIVALVRVVTGFPDQSEAWQAAVAVLAVATMFWGNLLAFWQVSVRRLLAYSAVAHAGYALVGVAANTEGGRDGAVLYFAAYGTAAVGAFLVLALMAREGLGDLLTDFNGLGRRRPFLAFVMTVFLISLVGVPLFAGFWGKFTVFWGAVQGDYVWLAVLGVVNSAVSLGYYARIVQRMYLVEPDAFLPGDQALLSRAAAGGLLTGPPMSVAGPLPGMAGAGVLRPAVATPALAAATPGATGVAAGVAGLGGRTALLEQSRSGEAVAPAGPARAEDGRGSLGYPPEAQGAAWEGGHGSYRQDWGLWAALVISFILTMLLGVAPRLLFSALGS